MVASLAVVVGVLTCFVATSFTVFLLGFFLFSAGAGTSSGETYWDVLSSTLLFRNRATLAKS